jgi:hypothetical protein
MQTLMYLAISQPVLTLIKYNINMMQIAKMIITIIIMAMMTMMIIKDHMQILMCQVISHLVSIPMILHISMMQIVKINHN